MSTHYRVIPDERLQRSQVDTIKLTFQVTAAKTAAQIALQGAPAIIGFDTGDFSQTAVDNLLALSTNTAAGDITVATSFGSTAMGTNVFGFVISHGSATSVLALRYESVQTAGGTPVNSFGLVAGQGTSTTAIPNTLQTTGICAVSAGGHIYGNCVMGNIDSVTAGYIILEIDIIQR